VMRRAKFRAFKCRRGVHRWQLLASMRRRCRDCCLAGLSDSELTLQAWARRMDPDGKIDEVVQMLNEWSEQWADMRQKG